jgi:crotonobetainyl-CoA:carnitine CoA-transferase CaiB-like acyl-CoA transferase
MDALEELQVIDLSCGVAGPIAGMFLADFGGDVVKVETPAGDPARGEPGFAAWNRGKHGVVVDPADPRRCAWLGDLIAGADVCIVSSPATLPRFGLDPDRLACRNPRLILTQTPPYPGEAPWLHGHESNGLLAAALGVAWRQSSWDGGPVESVYPHLLYVHGVWAAVCTVAALVERERSGFGQVVTVTGANAVMEAHNNSLAVDPDAPDPDTAVGPGGRHPTYSRFQARDGKWLASGALGNKFETALLGALGLSDLLQDERLGGKVENLIQPENVEWALGKVAGAFRTRDRDEWLEIITALGIPCGPLEDPRQWLDHDQVRAIGMRAELDDPERGHVVMPGVPIRLTATPGRPRGAAPRLGQHDAGIQPRPPRPAPAGMPRLSPGPLAGYRVLDQGTFVAAPYAGMLLAELGADVVKVEVTTGDPFRAQGFLVNRGMRSLAVNLRSEAGRDAFHRVAAASDVVLDALRPGVTTKLGADYDTLARVAPGIITVSLSGYGEGGPLSGRPSVDMVLQAMSGMMSAQGGDDEPVSNTSAIIDVTTAAMLALCTTLALYHRSRTGEGQRTWASLAATATFLQIGELVRYPGRPAAPVGGRDFLGTDPLDRYYQVFDGWLRVQAVSSDTVTAQALVKAGIPVDGERFEADPAGALAEALGALGAGEAVRRLADVAVAAYPARKISQAIRDPRLVSAEFVHINSAADGTLFITPGRYATFSRTARFGPLTAPGTGEHTAAVLREAGLTAPEIDELIRAGAVAVGGPMEQRLPSIYR